MDKTNTEKIIPGGNLSNNLVMRPEKTASFPAEHQSDAAVLHFFFKLANIIYSTSRSSARTRFDPPQYNKNEYVKHNN